MDNITLIGGEFWYDKEFIKKDSSELPGIFLGGGQSSLYVICEYLKTINISKVLLPAYICPTVLDRFDLQSIFYDFYEVNEDFSINLNSVRSKIGEFKALMFINFFGLSIKESEYCFLQSLKEQGVILIEDKVHTLDDSFIGDFAFNSYRKFCPYSGSILLSDRDVSEIITKMPLNERYFKLIKKARNRKTEFLVSKQEHDIHYLAAFKESEKIYYSEVSIGDMMERELISKLNIEKIEKQRKENYLYLLSKITKIKQIKPVFTDLRDQVPLGMPIFTNTRQRDFLRKKLMEKGIFLPVHWNLQNEKRINSNKMKEISSEILTLVIDQRYGKDDMDIMVSEIENILSN